MRGAARLLPALLLGLAALAPAPRADAVRDLRSWLRDLERGRIELAAEAFNELRGLLDAALEEAGPGEAGADGPPDEVDEVLLDLACAGLSRRSRDDGPENPLLGKVRETARWRLQRRLKEVDRALAWLGGDVLLESREPDERRRAALRVLAESRDDRALEPLLAAAVIDRPPELGRAAREALVGWPHPVATGFLREHTALGETPGLVEAATLARHLELLGEGLDQEQSRALLAWLEPALASEDWRTAARALSVVPPLRTDAVYPVLIDALATWVGRRGEEIASKRLEHDLAAELQRRSGRTIGPWPERWRNWWKLVQAGDFEPPPQAGEDGGERTEATFFSLRPSSQRVTFVLDRSGSMSAGLGGGGASRYETAVEQILTYLLVSGPETRFNVILFSDETRRWSARLKDATDSNRQAVERWLVANGPGGTTHLREAVESALELGRDGEPNLRRLESDTIVVLCDGETVQKSGWVMPTLDRLLDRAQVVFHCVQIGDESDGTLELLASRSGGHYVRVLR